MAFATSLRLLLSDMVSCNQTLIKETNSRISVRMHRKDIVIVNGDLVEGIFKSFVKSRLILLTVETFDQLVRLEPSCAGTDIPLRASHSLPRS